MVHSAAVIGIFIYFLAKLPKSLFIFLLPICVLSKKIIIFITEKVYPKYLAYLLGHHTIGGEKIYYLIWILYLLILFLSYKNKNFYVDNKIEINTFLFGCLIYLALGKIGIIGLRVSWYFIIYLLYIIKEIEKSNIFNLSSRVLKIVISLVMLVLLSINLKIDLDRGENAIYKYKTILIQNER